MSGLMNNFNLRFGNLGGFRGHTSTSGCPNTIVTQIHLYTESYMWCITGFNRSQSNANLEALLCLHYWLKLKTVNYVTVVNFLFVSATGVRCLSCPLL